MSDSFIKGLMAMAEEDRAKLPISIPIPLPGGRLASVTLPHDITEAEAKRVARVIETFGLPDK